MTEKTKLLETSSFISLNNSSTKSTNKVKKNSESNSNIISFKSIVINIFCILFLLDRTTFSKNEQTKTEMFYERNLINLISILKRNLENAEIKLNEQEYKENIKKQWRLLSKIVDRLLLYIFVIFSFLLLGGIVYQAPNVSLY